MAKLILSKTIAAPVAEVFAVFADLAHAVGRIKSITKLEIVTPGPIGAGTRFKETRMMFGKECTEEMEIGAFDPGRSYEILCNSCGAEYRTTFRFEPEYGGTRVDVEFSTRALTFFAKLMAPMGWLMKGMMKKCVEQDVNDLKAVVETRGAVKEAAGST